MEGLSVKQTMYYAAHLTIGTVIVSFFLWKPILSITRKTIKCLLGSKVSSYVKSTRVKQVMADLALMHVEHRGVEQLTQSEYRRLVIGTQLVFLKCHHAIH